MTSASETVGIVERVARALWLTGQGFAQLDEDPRGFDSLPEYAQEHQRDLARAALDVVENHSEQQAATIAERNEPHETGWLIERPAKDGRGPDWLRGYLLEGADPFLVSPTVSAVEALRFARKRDAEWFLHNLKQLHPGVWGECIITDHAWSMK